MNIPNLKAVQLDALLSAMGPRELYEPPKGGWLRAVRQAMSMPAEVLAKRMGVSRQSVTQLEQREAAGQASLSSMQRAVEEMGCDVVYALIPRDHLRAPFEAHREAFLRHRALTYLRGQGITADSLKGRAIIKEITERLPLLMSEARIWEAEVPDKSSDHESNISVADAEKAQT